MPYGPNVVPTMTSPTAPSGEALASSEFNNTYAAWKAFDGDDATFWYGYPSAPKWIRYQFAVAKTVTKYRYRTYSGPAEAPIDFTFEGSNDGTSWTVLDTQVGHATATNTWYEHAFTNTTAYLYYRMNVTVATGAVILMSLEMFEGSPGPIVPPTVTFDADRPGAVTKVALTTVDQPIVLGAGTYQIQSSADWTYNSVSSGAVNWPILSTAILTTEGNVTFYARTATTADLYILRVR